MKVYAVHDRIQSFLKDNPIDGIIITEDTKECNYLISGKYTVDDYNPNLKGVIIPYTGHNGIDLNAMKKNELMLFTITDRSKYVAEKAVTLTLSLLGKTINYHSLLKEGNWSQRNSSNRLPWVSIQGLTIGLFGYGRIGKLIHKMLKGFDCDFFTIDRSKEYPKDIYLVKKLADLIQVSDIIIIATPLNETTQGLFDESILSKMENKYLVNVGRGKIIDEESLFNALKKSSLKGFASDVWYNYPKKKEVMYPSNYPIHEFENVVLSNHSGGFTTKTNKEVNQAILKLLNNLRDGKINEQLDLKNLL